MNKNQMTLDLFSDVYDEIDADIERFKNREVKAKEIFELKEIGKPTALEFVSQYHYLGDAKFFAVVCFGMYCRGCLVGVSTFSLPQGNVALDGWFSLTNDADNVFELSSCAWTQG